MALPVTLCPPAALGGRERPRPSICLAGLDPAPRDTFLIKAPAAQRWPAELSKSRCRLRHSPRSGAPLSRRRRRRGTFGVGARALPDATQAAPVRAAYRNAPPTSPRSCRPFVERGSFPVGGPIGRRGGIPGHSNGQFPPARPESCAAPTPLATPGACRPFAAHPRRLRGVPLGREGLPRVPRDRRANLGRVDLPASLVDAAAVFPCTSVVEPGHEDQFLDGQARPELLRRRLRRRRPAARACACPPRWLRPQLLVYRDLSWENHLAPPPRTTPAPGRGRNPGHPGPNERRINERLPSGNGDAA